MSVGNPNDFLGVQISPTSGKAVGVLAGPIFFQNGSLIMTASDGTFWQLTIILNGDGTATIQAQQINI